MKKILCLLLFFFLTFKVSALEIISNNAVLYDLDNNSIVFEKNKDERISIASLTKIMTTITALENIDDINKRVTIPASAFNLDSIYASTAGFRKRQVVTYKDLLYGTLLSSGAESSNALAILISGKISLFVELMNQKVLDLELKNTHFSNVTGLEKKDHYGSVDDIAVLLKYAYRNEEFKNIFMTRSYKVSDGTLILESTMQKIAKNNKIDISYIIGGKTGFTNEAGYCLASIAYDSKHNKNYLLVTAGASTDKKYNHILDAKNIYEYIFNIPIYNTLVSDTDKVITLNTRNTKEDAVDIYINTIKREINDFDNSKVKVEYVGKKVLTSKDKMGNKIGKVLVYYDNDLVESVDVMMPYNLHFSVERTISNYVLYVLMFIFIIFFIRRSFYENN